MRQKLQYKLLETVSSRGCDTSKGFKQQWVLCSFLKTPREYSAQQVLASGSLLVIGLSHSAQGNEGSKGRGQLLAI